MKALHQNTVQHKYLSFLNLSQRKRQNLGKINISYTFLRSNLIVNKSGYDTFVNLVSYQQYSLITYTFLKNYIVVTLFRALALFDFQIQAGKRYGSEERL